jgi:UDP-N-acetylmuramoylalanine--D-glutamate ligase
MVGEILAAAERQSGWKYGRVWLGGNIGKSLLHDLPEMTADDIVVLELSSFQLEDAARIARSPRYALITNIRENHLDRHGTMASYAAAKSNIYRFQTRGDILGIPQEGADDWPVDDWRDRRPLVRFGIEPRKREIVLDVHESQSGGSRQLRFPQVEITVPGLHNLQNAAAAMALSQMLDLGHSISLAALRDFSGLIHRLEFVREVAGVRYYNDSKATTPDAAMTALRAFDRPVVMIVGGSDKGSSFSELAAAAVGQAKAVVCVGATRDRLVSEITRARGDSTSPSVHPAGDFEAALTLARSAAQGGDVVLLSPGCASYDMFVNYEQRGDTFKRVVRSWA